MKLSDVISDIGWSECSINIRNYARDYIDNVAASLILTKTQDRHVIVKRLMGNNIPPSIQSMIPIKIELIQWFCILPREDGMIHKDGLPRYSAFNIPLSGYTNS